MAKNDAHQIINALNAFREEYSKIPTLSPNDVVTDVDGDFLNVLIGSNTTLNPRGIVFIETFPYKKGKGGVDGEVWKDPWGSPFRIAIDADGDGKILVSTNGLPKGDTVIVKKAAVWNVSTNSKQQVRSWD